MATNGKWIWLLFFFAISTKLQGGQIVGELDKTSGNDADRFLYTLTIEGRVDGRPAFPEIPGVLVSPAGSQESTQIINGQITRSKRLRYLLEPAKAGTYTVPEIAVKVDGKIEKTLPLTFVVKAMDPKQQRGQTYFVERELSKDTLYEGDFLVVTNRIYIGGPVEGRPQVAPLEAPPGFRVYSFDNSNQYSKNIGGKDYQIFEQKYVVVADSSGEYSLPSFLAQVSIPQNNQRRRRDLFGFFNSGGKPKRMRTPPSQITVKPLPVKGRGRDFSTLVGQFTLSADVNPQKVAVGENVTVSVVVDGKGETENMVDIALNLESSNVKVYRDKPIDGDRIDYQEGLLGKREFKFAVIPSQEGTIDLGKVQLNFFDTETETYRSLQRSLGQIVVSPGTGSTGGEANLGSQATIAKQEVTQLGQDILGLHAMERLQSPHNLDFTRKLLLWLLGIGGPMIAVVSFLMAGRRTNVLEREQRRAYRLAFKTFQKEKQRLLAETSESELSPDKIQSLLKSYLQSRLKMPTGSLTAKEIAESLRQHGVDQQDIEDFLTVFAELDRIRYGNVRDRSRDSLLQRIETTILKLEKQF